MNGSLIRIFFTNSLKHFPKFSIDLFASLLNRQVERYASWHPDPHAAIVDSFSVSWANEYFYAFPPFCFIPKCLERISRDQAEGVLLVPAWPTQTWYPLLLQMLTQQHKLLLWTPQVELLRHPLGKVQSMQAKLKLMDCPLSGNIIGARTFLTTLGYLVMWNLFCRERKILAHYHTLNHVLESLYTQLHLSYSSINSTRSALSCFISIAW